MKFGNLNWTNADARMELLGETVKTADLTGVLVTEIDSSVSDTVAFCEKYQIDAKECANCVIVKGVRGDIVKYAAVLIGGDSRADINGVVRRALDVKKISFAPMTEAVEMTKMAFGAITPIGLPADWTILVDEDVAKQPHVVIGSGVRESKLLVNGENLAELPNVTVMDLKKIN
ncbi:MAG: hypothetical protein LBM09_01875 [Candidatus Nomurabacteria bacterium]|jgi:prolyl-tRNA editing enzyme YbaK/EbsC (Cys-tRNA(Pro) deacylase)|nr:hypothetical protein [Candidatus Nomurabacteria bacterium]